MEFIYGGKRYSLTREQVEAHMRSVEPGTIYQHAVEVNGVRYPVTQVLRVATGVRSANTDRARNILRRLGFFDRMATATTASQRSPATEQAPGRVLEIQTVTGGVHEFELGPEQDVQALEAEISQKIGGDGSYQGRSRRPGAVDGTSVVTVAWKQVAAATLYQREE
ncbi:MAG: hypothetical protein ACRDPY_35830 [Streptosporangiaceae bacterium]